MNSQQALQVLSEATASISTIRQQHLLILQAIEVLKQAITPKDKPVQPLTLSADQNADALNKASKEIKE